MYREKITKKKKSTQTDKTLSPQWLRIEEFFSVLGEDGPAAELWNMLKLALTADNDHCDKRDRSNMLFFYENVKALFEDSWMLLQAQKQELGIK